MNKAKMLEWIGTRHVGVSSRTMWVALMGVARGVNDFNGDFDTPYDWDDFSRCYDLVTYGEVTKEELQKVVEAFPYYKPIIDRWDELVEAYLSPGGKGVYRILDGVHDEVMRLKGYVNLGGGLYSKQL
nr:MAG TPA: hypothetical protein [Caudoviricetes sp.]